MDSARKDLLIRRICAGFISLPVEFKGKTLNLTFRKPSPSQLYRAEEIYIESYEDGLAEGLFSQDELNDYLYNKGFWDKSRQDRLDLVKGHIEDFKIKMFKAVFRSRELSLLRKALELARNEVNKLETEKSRFNYISAAGNALSIKSRYLIASSLYKGDKPLFKNEIHFWNSAGNLLDLAAAVYAGKRIGESEFRELARSDTWRMIWNMKKAEKSIFGIPAIEYTEEQRGLVSWSIMYDNIFEHPDCPGEDIVEDDDILDGWLLIKKREREDAKLKKKGDELASKAGNAQEVFVMADSVDDAKKVESLNDATAKQIKKARLDLVKKKGVVNELEMPDTKQDLKIQAAMKFSQAMKNR